MKRAALIAVFVPFLLLACDKSEPSTAQAASATAAAPTAAPTPTHAAASAAPAASAAEAPPTKEVVVTVRKPEDEKEKTVKAQLGGSVTVYLPQYEGSSWTVSPTIKALGKATEQTIPGFAGPTVPAHEFKWTTDSKALKVGQKHTLHFANKKGANPGPEFTLTIEFVD